MKRSRRGGGFDLRLPAEERQLLQTLGPQMRIVLTRPPTAVEELDGAAARLFPVAYPEDEDRQTEYRLLVHDELMESHLAALTVLEETAGADRLDEDQLMTWMRAVNDIRLVLGTRLNVSEGGEERSTVGDDPNDPMTAAFGVYDYLTHLQGDIVDALSG